MAAAIEAEGPSALFWENGQEGRGALHPPARLLAKRFGPAVLISGEALRTDRFKQTEALPSGKTRKGGSASYPRTRKTEALRFGEWLYSKGVPPARERAIGEALQLETPGRLHSRLQPRPKQALQSGQCRSAPVPTEALRWEQKSPPKWAWAEAGGGAISAADWECRYYKCPCSWPGV